MPKRDLQNGWGLFLDIFRETTPVVRWSIMAGLALGVVGIVLMFTSGIVGPGGAGLHFAWLAGIVLLFAGGFLGCLVGVVLEYFFPPRDKKKRKR